MLSTQKHNTATTGLTVINGNRLGDMAEQWVKLLCHWKGCEVFQNVGCTGSTDLVIVHPSLGTLQIDVKCSQWKTDTKTISGRWYNSHSSQVKRPVYAVCVIPDGDIANWKVHWRNIRRGGNRTTVTPVWDCPPGWESFWDNDHRIYSTNSTKPTVWNHQSF